MANPWEKYQSQAESGPWEKFKSTQDISPQKESKAFIERVGEDLSNRKQELLDTIDSSGLDIEDPLTFKNAKKFLEKSAGLLVPTGLGVIDYINEAKDLYGGKELTPSEFKAQVVGKGVAGSAFDVIGEALVSIWDFAGDTVKDLGPSDLLPHNIVLPGKKTADVIKETTGFSVLVPENLDDELKQSIESGWNALVDSEIGQQALEAAQGGINKWMDFKENNPRVAKDIESAINTTLLFAPAKVKAKAGPTSIGKQASKIEMAAKKQAYKSREAFSQQLVQPKLTPTVLTDQAKRTKVVGKGLFQKNVVIASDAEKEMAREVARIKSVKPSHSIQKNLSIIMDTNKNIAKHLRHDIGKRRVFIPKNSVTNSIDDALYKLAKDEPGFIGDFSSMPELVAKQARKVITEQPSTPVGLLNARQNFDKWMLKRKGKMAFGSDRESAFSLAAKEARKVMNKKLAEYSPSAQVTTKLRKQSLLFDAIDNMAPKAAAESNSVIGRAWQNAMRALPVRSALSQELGLLFGLGGLGAAAAFAPWLTGAFGLTAVAYGARALSVSPSTKMGIAKLIRLVDRAILTSKNPSMVKQLRADRAALKETLEAIEIEKETGSNSQQGQ